MYHTPTSVFVTGGGAGVGTLAFTGLNAVHYLVAVATLIFCGAAMLRLVPRRES